MLGKDPRHWPPVPVDASLRDSPDGGSYGNRPQALRRCAALTCGVAVAGSPYGNGQRLDWRAPAGEPPAPARRGG